MPKVQKKSKKKSRRHDPLEKQIMDSMVEKQGKLRKPKADKEEKKQEDDNEFLPERLSRKLLQTAQTQQQEEKISVRKAKIEATKEEDSDDEDDNYLQEAELEEVEEIEIDEDDERELSLFMPQATSKMRTLADIIMDKIKEKEEAQAATTQEEAVDHGLDPKVVQVYTEIGSYLAQFSSGKIPKPFKIIPSLKNWEHVLYITNPEKWSPNAMYYATKMFAANLNAKMAQRFYNLVLYPRVRDDIAANKRLNYHLYAALKKAIFKPSAFFRGIILPLAQEECTAREAIIISSVLQKVSIPAAHSAVALLKLSQMEYSGPVVLFINTLLDKKYSLPHRVIEQLVIYFGNYEADERRLPVCWHQALLTFVQRYKMQFTTAQRTQLKAVLRKQVHNSITPEIRRELNSQANAGTMMETM